MSESLDVLAQQVADDQAAIEGQSKDTRKHVLRMGKLLTRMQKAQKKEQDETGQTWKEWAVEQKRTRCAFPGERSCQQYILIAKYPAAYQPGMSIKEGYKEAGRWKKNGGNPPLPVKTEIKTRPLITIGSMARQQAGHASAQTTLASYIDPRIVEQRTAADVLPSLKIDGDS